jgi:2-keto-4-pentenoate hydratase/2-oxohepta-3-ene-1,7-dioic acid hydratase in catechol pathway
MRILRLLHGGAPRVAVRDDSGAVRLAPIGSTIADLLSRNDFRESVAESGELVQRDLSDSHLAPIDPTAIVVNIGSNYHDHALPAQDAPRPELTWFIKSPRTWVAHGDEIRVPEQFPHRVDYEGELGVVFGTAAHRVTREDAWGHIAAVTLLNDVSARDAWPELAAATTPGEERAAWNRMMLGKQLPTFGPIGPELVTIDEVSDPDSLVLRTLLNGDVVQQAAVAQMKIGVADLVARLSEFFAFQPGDVISTGTPGGVGQASGRYLRAGDEVTIEIEGIGALTNPVVGP